MSRRAGSIQSSAAKQLPEIKVKLGLDGRLLIPAAYRRALRLRVGDTVMLREREGKLELTSVAQKRNRARRLIAEYIPQDVSLADSLIDDRRGEAERERG